MTLGEKLKKLRLENSLTQEDLARKIFVTRNAISKWETNRGIPSIDSLKNLANEFKVSLDYLLNEEELFSIVAEHKQTIENTKNTLYAFFLFIGYFLIGTLVPYYSFDGDPTSGLAIFIILLPLCYIILGILTVLFSIDWPHVLISSALAITPIFLFFDIVLPKVVLSFWAVIYYILFLFVYFIANKLINKTIEVKEIYKLKKLFFILAIALTSIYAIHTSIACINLYYCEFCSAPWYLELVVNTLMYIIPLTIFWVFYVYYLIANRRLDQAKASIQESK